MEISITSPLLVWVDDNPRNNERFFEDAKTLGIDNIERLLSTGEAKSWIDTHLGFFDFTDLP